MPPSTETDALTWKKCIPDGLVLGMVDAGKGAVGVAAALVWALRWFIVASVAAPIAFWAFADGHSAWMAARGLLLGWAILGSFVLWFALSLAMLPLLPQEFRIDEKGFSTRSSSREDWPTALSLPWAEITAITLVRREARVPYLNLTSESAQRIRFPTRIQVSASVDLTQLTALVERFHAKPVDQIAAGLA
jgi:hypothetical protein